MGDDGFGGQASGRNPAQEEAAMPSGVFPVPPFRSNPSETVRERPSYAARWRRGRLDPELARGTDPAASAELGLRAAQLRSREERSRLANRLVTFLGDARGPNLGGFRAKTRARHDAIRESADDLMALALRLRDDEPITVRGAALTALVVDRATSPLRHGDGHDLEYAIRAARVALDAPDRDARDLATAA
jgi:hypothetical protein